MKNDPKYRKRLKILQKELRKHNGYDGIVVGDTHIKFEMSDWGNRFPYTIDEAVLKAEKKFKFHLCKTAACALGTASFIPELRKMGFRGKFSKRNTDIIFTIRGKETMPYDVGFEFFGLNSTEFDQIFTVGISNTPEDVAIDIEYVLEGHYNHYDKKEGY